MGESESEDSENEGCMGNVTRVVMRPPNHSGKPKKGHLCFDASFETGNLGFVDLVSTYEYDLFIRPDTCNPRIRLWFNFTVDNTKAEQRVVLNLVNFSKKRNSLLYGMTPIVKSTSRPTWQRMPNDTVFYHSSPYHNNNFILSLAFNFDKEEDVYQFAFCYPYSYTKQQAHMDLIEKRNYPFFKRELLGQSIKRRVELLTITHPKNMCPNGKVNVVTILSRVHPGETPASYVCQGIIDFLVSNHKTAVSLRENIIFKIIPMLNPDGVFLGNSRCSQIGLDLNRSWSKISKWLHPTLDVVYCYITTLDQDKNINLDIVLDIHAHSNLGGAFVCGNTYNDVYRYERHIVFPKLLSQKVLGYENDHCVFNRDSNKAGSARRVLCNTLKDTVNCYSLNVSFYGYHSKTSTFKYYTEEKYHRVGKNVVQAFREYYKTIGLIETVIKKVDVTRLRVKIPRWLMSARVQSSILRRRHSAPSRSVSVLDLNLRPVTTSSVRSRPRSHPRRREPPSILWENPPVLNPPSLTIIDFNKMTRGGLDKAIISTNKFPPHKFEHLIKTQPQ